MVQHLLWVNPVKKRYYRLRVETDLLGDITLVRTWGSLVTDLAGMHIKAVPKSDLETVLGELTKRREKRGYVSAPPL